jgi:hypothetical protein
MDFPRMVVRGVRAGPTPVEIVVEDAERARGRIVGELLQPDGKPAAGVALNLWHVEERMWRSYTSDDAGRLEVEAVPPGSCELELRPRDFPWKKLGAHAVQAGQVVDLGTITLDTPSFLRGRILGGTEEQLDSLRLVLTREGHNGEAGILQREGSDYRSSALEAGSYRLHLTGDGVISNSWEFEVAAGEETVQDVELERAGTRRVRVDLDAQRALPRWVSLMVLDGDTGRSIWSRSFNPEGPELEVLVSVRPGTHRLRARTDDDRTAETVLQVDGFGGRQPALNLGLR